MKLRLQFRSDGVYRPIVIPGAFAPIEHISSMQMGYIARLSSTLVACIESIRRAIQITGARVQGEVTA